MKGKEELNIKLLTELKYGCLWHWDKNDRRNVDVLVLHSAVTGCPICRQIEALEEENNLLKNYNARLTNEIDNYKKREKTIEATVREKLVNKFFKD